MKIQTNFLIAALIALCLCSALSAEGKIKLSGNKKLVLSEESRASVLSVARQHLSEKSEGFLALTTDLDSPFTFEQAPVVAGGDAAPEAPAAVVNYDDASVLRAVAQNFEQQVRGTLARGSTNFLQLRGGSMVQPGASFPVTIPQAEGQTFIVTISDISSDSYTLTLGEATQTISLNATGTGTGAQRMD